MIIRYLLLIFVAVICASCSSIPSSQVRRQNAEAIAAAHAWTELDMAVGGFELRGYVPQRHGKSELLTIYIEGDGLAWINADTPSLDPTPIDPLALRLAIAQPAGLAAYLARPCQFLAGRQCAQKYWTNMRFAPEIVAAMNDAVNVLKVRFSAQHIALVGYSGGGAIAALLAARRTDVVVLGTVAGNLDHVLWSNMHRISPLTGSLNPADEGNSLKHVRQLHFMGERDRVIPQQIVRSYAAKTGLQSGSLVLVPDADHRCCWADHWPELWSALDALAD